MKKKVLIVAPFCSLPGESYFNRFLYLAESLSCEYAVTLVTSSFRHYDKKFRDKQVPELGGRVEVVLIDEPGYKSNVGVKRLYSHHVFCSKFEKWLLGSGRWDLVYSAFPLIKTNIVISKLKKKFGYKHVLDVQDVWPESISSVIPMIRWFPVWAVPFSWRADAVYSSVDALVAVSETYMLRALRSAKKNTPREVVYIGSSASQFGSVHENKSESTFRLVYLGTLSYSYDVSTVISAVNELAAEGYDVEFHILGGGPFEERLRRKAGGNVFFHGFCSFEDSVKFVKGCDVAVNPIVKGGSQSVTNKLSDYLAIGVPVISSQENAEAKKLLRHVFCENYKPGSVSDFKRAFRKMYSQRESMFFKPVNLFDRQQQYFRINLLFRDLLGDGRG